MSEVVVVIGAGGIGAAIARRHGIGKTVLLADCNPATLDAAVEALREASYVVEARSTDVTSRASLRSLADHATGLGAVVAVVNAAGLSPNMAPPGRILAVDLYGAALIFEEFERVVAAGGAGLVVSSMAGHMLPLPAEQEKALAYAPTDDLPSLPFLRAITSSGDAYMVAKRANILRAQAAAMTWGDRGARVNSISPGIVSTPLAQHEFKSESGPIYRAFLDASSAKRMAPPDEIALAASYLLGPESAFINGSDLLIDGGVIAAMRAGRLPSPA